MKYNLNNIVEICETKEDKLAGRIKIKLIAHEIYPTDGEYANRNGIHWVEEYTRNNMPTAISMPLVAQYIGDKEDGIIGGHGEMIVHEGAKDGEGLEFEDSEVVGTVIDAYITDIEIGGEMKKVLMLEGYIYSQRNLGLVKFLREQVNEKKNKICGSIEINNDNEHDEIVYANGKYNDDGSLNLNRIPQFYSYSAHSLLYLETEADATATIVELNSLKGDENVKNIVVKQQIVEINKVTVEEVYKKIADSICESLNKTCSYDFSVCELYLDTCEVVVKDYTTKDTFYMTTYKIENNQITIGDIFEVENTWIPKSKSSPIEINQKEGNGEMDKELNTQIAELNSKLENVTNSVAELNSVITQKEATIVQLNETIVESQKQVSELNEKVTKQEQDLAEANKKLEECAKKEEEEKAKAEMNTYVDTEVKPLKLDDAEMNQIKDITEINALKAKVAEICIARVKAIAEKAPSKTENNDVETNSMFFTKDPVKQTISDEFPSLF